MLNSAFLLLTTGGLEDLLIERRHRCGAGTAFDIADAKAGPS
jgi:hypothetical protein